MKTMKLSKGLIIWTLVCVSVFMTSIYAGAKVSELYDTRNIEIVEFGTLPDGSILADEIVTDGFGNVIEKEVITIVKD